MRCHYVDDTAMWFSLKCSCLCGQSRQGAEEALPREGSPTGKHQGTDPQPSPRRGKIGTSAPTHCSPWGCEEVAQRETHRP